MTIQDLKRNVEQSNINNLYVFTGEESYLKRHWVRKIGDNLNLNPIFIDNVENIKQGSLLEPVHLYIVYTNNIKDINLYNNYVIVICDDLDKRTSFYKQNKGNIVEFNKLDSNQLLTFINKKVNLNKENCLDLIHRCNSDLSLIDLELDKFLSYNENFSNEDYTNIKDTFFDVVLDDITFSLSNAILEKNNIMYYYNKCMQINQSILGMLNAVYINIRQLLQIQTSGKDIEKSTGLNYYVINKIRPNVGKYSNEELIHILNLIFKLDFDIKTGKIPQEIAFKYLLCEIL